jgi:hypothetical protein
MSALIGVRIELRDAHGKLVGAVYCEDRFEAVAVPQRGDLVALAAITGLTAISPGSFCWREALRSTP